MNNIEKRFLELLEKFNTNDYKMILHLSDEEYDNKKQDENFLNLFKQVEKDFIELSELQNIPEISDIENGLLYLKDQKFRNKHPKEAFDLLLNVIDNYPMAFLSFRDLMVFLRMNRHVGSFEHAIQIGLKKYGYDINVINVLDDKFTENNKKYRITFVGLSDYWLFLRKETNKNASLTHEKQVKYIEKFYNLKHNECSRCHKICDNIEIHHLDENHSNDVVENTILVCPNCHTQIHVENRTLKSN